MPPTEGSSEQLPVRALLSADCYPHEATRIDLIETHISWVVLAGEFAYKIKKPVDLGFLDFTDLTRRKHYCEEEVRLNRRLAPELYLDVVSLRKKDGRLLFGDDGEIIEYAVRMRRFEQANQLDRQLELGLLAEGDMDEIACLIGEFHDESPSADNEDPWGTTDAIVSPARENFLHLGNALRSGRRGALVERLRDWTESRIPLLAPAFDARKKAGRVRECHGDLHLRNMARVNGRIVAFDGIEFDPALRWIDVISDAAFLVMDLDSRGRHDLAWRFLNGWLQATGDYESLGLLRWYLVYRHMVRAKVDAIRISQPGTDSAESTVLRDRIDAHLSLAFGETEQSSAAMLVTCGVSGSGKSWLAERLATRIPAVWARSDIERKRLFGMPPRERPSQSQVEEIYGDEASRRTYERLVTIAKTATAAGRWIIVDATFLARNRRTLFLDAARQAGIPALILACEAGTSTLEDRVLTRQTRDQDPSDAGIEVLRKQLQERDPFGEDEPVMEIRTDQETDLDELSARIRERIASAPL